MIDPVYQEALERMRHVFTEAAKSGVAYPHAMTLATVDGSGQPTLRTMMVRQFDEHGLLFFTNINSRKGEHLAVNPKAALCLFCGPLNQQLTIEGKVVRLDDSEADRYWRSRDRDGQLAALVSEQSAALDDLDELKAQVQQVRQQYQDGRVPRPPHWAGYRLEPDRIEFWHSGWRHLHDRICFQREQNGWAITRLQP
jgi:pyridoxamine 5'-phosphate oxidase